LIDSINSTQDTVLYPECCWFSHLQ